MTVLVTGATGKTGRHVVANLLAAGEEVRALTRSPDRALLPSDVTVIPGDLTVPESLMRALEGVDSMFLFPVLPAIAEVVALAKRAGVRRVVLFTGAWAAGLTQRDRDSWVFPRYRAAEASLESDGPGEWTIVRPAPFATNMLWYAQSIRTEGVVRAPYPDAVCPVTHEADLAAVVALALTSDGHAGAKYTVTGPAAISQAEQVAAIGRAIGRGIRFEVVTEERWRQTAGSALRPGIVGDLLREWSDTAHGPGTALPALPTVERLTGEPARTFEQWALDHVDDFSRPITGA